MLKRLIFMLALGAALVACTPSGTASTPGAETLAPVESEMASEAPSESAAPS